MLPFPNESLKTSMSASLGGHNMLLYIIFCKGMLLSLHPNNEPKKKKNVGPQLTSVHVFFEGKM